MAYLKTDRVEFIDGSTPSVSTTTYETQDEAIGRAKQQVGNWMLNANCATVGVIVIDTDGFVNRFQDYWKRTTNEQPEE